MIVDIVFGFSLSMFKLFSMAHGTIYIDIQIQDAKDIKLAI